MTWGPLHLSSPLFGQETGVLYQYETSSGIQWKTFGNEKVQPKYEGEIKNGKMDGLGVLIYPYGEKSIVGEWKNGKEWNTKHRKKDGTLLGKYENGKWIVSLFVSVGQSGTILTSSDGTSWTERTSGTSEYPGGVTYGNGTFVMVDQDGIILTSSDGTTWTERTSGTSKSLSGVTSSQ